MKAIWDEAFLKQRAGGARAEALAVQSGRDWTNAELLLEQAMSNVAGGFLDCALPVCRREQRCVGNRPICMPRCALELEPGAEQALLEQFYAEIQEERRDAAAAGRAPDVERVMTDRVHKERVYEENVYEENLYEENVQAEQAADRPASPPARDQPGQESASPAAAYGKAAPRSAAAPSAPAPQLHKPQPPAAAPAASAPPARPEPQTDPEVAERVNRIWADYVEAQRRGEPPRRAGPRIRSLSDEPAPSLPWWRR